MESKTFKNIFSGIAKDHGFKYNHGAWFKENSDGIVVLDLQRSNYGKYYQLMIKMYIHFLFGDIYKPSNELVKNGGNIFRGTPTEYNPFFDFEHAEEDALIANMDRVFREFIVPYTDRVLQLGEIKKLSEEGMVYLLPVVEKNLLRLLEMKQ